MWIATAAFAAVDRDLEAAARDLGATHVVAFRDVTLRLAAPGLVASAIFVFLESLDEFTGTFFVGVPQVSTLPLLLYNAGMGGNYQIALDHGVDLARAFGRLHAAGRARPRGRRPIAHRPLSGPSTPPLRGYRRRRGLALIGRRIGQLAKKAGVAPGRGTVHARTLDRSAVPNVPRTFGPPGAVLVDRRQRFCWARAKKGDTQASPLRTKMTPFRHRSELLIEGKPPPSNPADGRCRSRSACRSLQRL